MNKGPKTNFELAVIDKVREKRTAMGLSQDDLAAALDLTRGFIGQIESPNYPAKYNLNHLNKLAKEFRCSPREFLPSDFVEEESGD